MRIGVGLCILLLVACQGPAPDAARYPGGSGTYINPDPLGDRHADAFSQPTSNLNPMQRGLFTLGNSFFTSPWVAAPASTQARDGLGPQFNAAACQDCHIRDGRGHPPETGAALRAAVVRLGGADGKAHPILGPQLQPLATAGLLPEGSARVHWEYSQFRFADGELVELRRPRVRVSGTAAWRDQDRAALRMPPPMIGLGLLEAIPESALRAQAARSTGRLQQLPATETLPVRVGRFGWKAGAGSVREQSLKALAEDMGITSSLFAQDNCSATQSVCRQQLHGGEPELSPAIEEGLVFYASHLAVPERRDWDRREVRAGEALFHQLGCAGCHRPNWLTQHQAGQPTLSAQTIWPYTDLLLHDMGAGLADGMVEGAAGPQDWRTPPLWGLGHTHTVSGAGAGYLHDGRARSLTEAILWHGGEADHARQAWADLPAAQRRLLLRFLASL